MPYPPSPSSPVCVVRIACWAVECVFLDTMYLLIMLMWLTNPDAVSNMDTYRQESFLSGHGMPSPGPACMWNEAWTCLDKGANAAPAVSRGVRLASQQSNPVVTTSDLGATPKPSDLLSRAATCPSPSASTLQWPSGSQPEPVAESSTIQIAGDDSLTLPNGQDKKSDQQ